MEGGGGDGGSGGGSSGGIGDGGSGGGGEQYPNMAAPVPFLITHMGCLSHQNERITTPYDFSWPSCVAGQEKEQN